MPTLVCDNYRVEHMEKHNRHIDELITKYLDKSLTREECAELRRYLAEDKKHLAYFAEIRDLWLYNTALWQPIISTNWRNSKKIMECIYHTHHYPLSPIVVTALYTKAKFIPAINVNIVMTYSV